MSTVDRIDVPDGSLGSVYAKLIREFADLATPISVAATLPDSPFRYSIVTTCPPIVERPRRLTGDRLTAAKAEFAMLLDRGIIRPSSSQWDSPLNLVSKKDGSLRATGDYRRLNACTIPDRYPLPVIEDLLQEVQGQVFSKVDLQRAFHQIPVAEEDPRRLSPCPSAFSTLWACRSDSATQRKRCNELWITFCENFRSSNATWTISL